MDYLITGTIDSINKQVEYEGVNEAMIEMQANTLREACDNDSCTE